MFNCEQSSRARKSKRTDNFPTKQKYSRPVSSSKFENNENQLPLINFISTFVLGVFSLAFLSLQLKFHVPRSIGNINDHFNTNRLESKSSGQRNTRLKYFKIGEYLKLFSQNCLEFEFIQITDWHECIDSHSLKICARRTLSQLALSTGMKTFKILLLYPCLVRIILQNFELNYNLLANYSCYNCC